MEEENKGVEFENKKLLFESSSAIKMYKVLKNNSIPKSKIKERIEQLNKEEQELQNSISDEEREEYSDANISFSLMDINIRRKELQELLEE